MMQERSADQYLRPYREAVAKFGPGFHALLWSSREAQQLRFDVMLNLAVLDDCTVLDAGCGNGDFAAHLLERGVPFARYIGIDAVPEMIEEANRRGLVRCEFRMGDLLHDDAPLREAEPDIVCISGTLNTMDEASAMRLVKASFDAAKQAVAFNFLSNRPDEKWQVRDTGPASRFDTLRWLDWSLQLTSRVTFTQDYLDGHDATILLRKT